MNNLLIEIPEGVHERAKTGALTPEDVVELERIEKECLAAKELETSINELVSDYAVMAYEKEANHENYLTISSVLKTYGDFMYHVDILRQNVSYAFQQNRKALVTKPVPVAKRGKVSP
jgi:hypothetical protein